MVAGQVLADQHRPWSEAARQSGAQFGRVNGRPAGVRPRRLLRLAPLRFGSLPQDPRPRFRQLRPAFGGRQGFDRGKQAPEAFPRVAHERLVNGIVAAHVSDIHADSGEARPHGSFGASRDNAAAEVFGAQHQDEIYGPLGGSGVQAETPGVMGMGRGKVRIALAVVRDRQAERFGQPQKLVLRARLPNLVAGHEDRIASLDQHAGGAFDAVLRGPGAGAGQEPRPRIDVGLDALRFQGVVRHGEVHGPSRRRDGGLEGPAQHQRERARFAGFPRDLRELPVDLLLVEPWARGKHRVVAPHLVVVQTGRDDQRGTVLGGVVHLAGRLRGSRDDVQIEERGLAASAVIAIRHRNHHALVQAENQLHAWPVQERIEEADLEGAGIGEQVFDARGLHLFDDRIAARARNAARPIAILAQDAIGRFQRPDQRLRRGGREPACEEAIEHLPPGELTAQITLDEFPHGEPPAKSLRDAQRQRTPRNPKNRPNAVRRNQSSLCWKAWNASKRC